MRPVPFLLATEQTIKIWTFTLFFFETQSFNNEYEGGVDFAPMCS